MANLLPFRGVLYDTQVTGDIRNLVAPPYDVIDAEAQHALYARHPENVIRLELGLENPSDGERENRYTRAAASLRDWLSRGALRRDDTPAIYSYTIEHRVPGIEGSSYPRTLKGFIGLIELQEFGTGGVLPHENTRAAAKTDRLNLLEACRSNFSPIFSLFSDPEQRAIGQIDHVINAQKPRVEFTDEEGFLHRLWAITDPQILNTLVSELKGKSLFIADGHHRYETALNYRRLRREQDPNTPDSKPRPFDHVLMLCASLEDPGLTILPTHRVLKIKLPALEQIRTRLRDTFTFEEFTFAPDDEREARTRFLRTLHSKGQHGKVFGLALRDTWTYVLCSLRPERDTADSGSPRDRLDVSALHAKLLTPLCPSNFSEGTVVYTKSNHEALDLIRAGKAEAALLLNPTRVNEVSAVASAGERMPHKSTYFFPKPLTGLVMHVMEEDGR